ncbi:hypothetical protein [Actinoplanes sp. NPDC051851]|uniref:hypothetical protein n=1 Tax=Actinoplanes sp. NPDC051851 TaxID=3154753 RepID=UPI00341D0B56
MAPRLYPALSGPWVFTRVVPNHALFLAEITSVIDAMLARPSHPKHRTTVQEVYDHLTENLKVTVSFSAVSAYVRERRKYRTSQNRGEAIEPSDADGKG